LSASTIAMAKISRTHGHRGARQMLDTIRSFPVATTFAALVFSDQPVAPVNRGAIGRLDCEPPF